MAIKIKFDNELRTLPPTLVLATRSGHKLGCIPAQHIVLHGSLTNGYELSFSVSKYDNWEKIELWDKLEDFKLAWSPEWDIWFELDVTTNEADNTVKNITATSIGEAELSQVMLYNIEINTEADIARKDYKPTIVYNSKDHTASLLDRIMEKTPHYKIRHVDTSIAKLQRTFTFDEKSLKDVLSEICKEVNALLIIHSGTDDNGMIERAYSIYDLEEHCPNCGYRGKQENGKCPECGKTDWSFGYGEDTGIFISTENLADDITYETAKDSVKNCFRLVAGDDLMTAAVAAANPNGTRYLWYISDKVKEDMSPALRNRLKEYDDLYKATQDSSFSFPNADIRNYNTLAAKYGKNQIGTVEKFAGVLDAYYDTIDFELYLEHGLLPDVNPPMTSAADELKKLTANISPVSVRTLTTLSSTTATSYVTQAARSIVDPRYSISAKDETLDGNTWSGSFIITRYSDEKDTVTSANVSVRLNENYENFIRRQIERVLNSSEFEDLDIVALFKKDGAAFASAIKQYSLAMLKSFYDACQACLNILVEHNSANESVWAEIYHSLYEPYYAKLGYLQSEISLRESEITTIHMAQDEIENVITSTQDKLDFEKFMGEELWLEFAAYRREDTYQNDNYISDGLDNAALIENARDFLKTAQEEIERSATLQHSISANLSNLLVMEEFKGLTDNFELGNWLRIRVDDNVYILRLIDYEIDFDNLETLNVEYSDVVASQNSANDIKSILDSASSMSSSYGSVSRQARHGDNSNRQLDDWVAKGLEATKLRFLSDAEDQNIAWDKNGMLFRKWDNVTESYEPTQLRIINSTIVVTDDNWKTVKTALGGFDYKSPVSGEVKHGYGINAELLIGRLILGEELGLYNENNSLTFDRNGLNITNGDNSFMVSPDGSNLLVVECGEGNKVMWVDEKGELHLRPTEFSLTTGETLQGAIDEAKKARNLQVVFTNEYEGVPTDESGNYTGTLDVKTRVSTYYGSVEVTDKCTYTYTPSSGVTGSWNPDTYEYTITQLNTDSGYVDITAQYDDNNDNKFIITKRFNVAKVKAGVTGANGENGNDGQNGYTFIIKSSAEAITRHNDGTLTPNTISFSFYKREGDSTENIPYEDGYVTVLKSSDGINFSLYDRFENPTNEIGLLDLSHYLERDVVALRVVVSKNLNGYQTEFIDYKTIPIVNDGKDISDLTSEEVFNALTDNGKVQGLFMEKDEETGEAKIYLNADYIKGGTIVGDLIKGGTIQGTNLIIGGNENWYGSVLIYDAQDNVAGRWDNTGIRITQYGLITITGAENDWTAPQTTLGTGGIFFYSTNKSTYAHIMAGRNSQTEEVDISISSTQKAVQGSNIFLTAGGGYDYYYGYSYPMASITISPLSGVSVYGNFRVSGGQKSRLVETENYGYRLLDAMESPTPVFSDMGSAVCDENGIAFISLDLIFAETIENDCIYKVFFTQTSPSNVYRVGEKTENYFTIIGEPGATLDWIIYAPQKGYQNERLEEAEPPINPSSDSILQKGGNG